MIALLLALVAQAAEYRAITLTDGRAFVGEVVSTEATGMVVRVPQGETLVRFEDLADMVPVDESAYAAQDDLLVYVASDGPYRTGFEAPYRAMPKVTVVGDAHLSEEERRAAAACSTDVECVVGALSGNAKWMWVVACRFDGSMAVFDGATTKGSTRHHTTAPRSDVAAVNIAATGAIGLSAASTPVPEPEPVVPEPAKERRPMTADRAVALAFVPVPGLPNAMAGDWTGFGIGLAAAVPATVLWIGATGKATQSPAGHVALGLGGYYAATVVTNQVLAATRLRDEGVTVGVGPTKGGAALTVTVTR